MSEEKTQVMGESDSFEARVLAQLEDISRRLLVIERREDERAVDTKPGLENIISEVRGINTSVQTHLKNFERVLSVINDELLRAKADQRNLEDRMSKLEVETRPQVIPQDRTF